MLSIMETTMGLTVVNPQGKTLRIPKNNTNYGVCREIIKNDLPAQQVWNLLQEVIHNPLKTFIDWMQSFDIRVAGVESSIMEIGNFKVSKSTWLPLFKKIHARAGTPVPVIQFFEKVNQPIFLQEWQDPAPCIHWSLHQGIKKPNLVTQGFVAPGVKPGDAVQSLSSTANIPCLVSYADYRVSSEGTLEVANGKILDVFEDLDLALEVLEEPVILGQNITFRCEEGSADGWLEDFSFDSLAAAKRNLKEIQASGSEARIINRMTNAVVATS